MCQAAEDQLRRGDPQAALAALQEAVRSTPADARLRVFLFQLLCVLGDWPRAVAQLRTCATLDAAAEPMARTYREAIICERWREKVFAGTQAPAVLGEPEPWLALLIEALRLEATGAAGAAADLRAQAFEAAPASPGTLDGTPFAWLADADPRLGPVLEIIVNGRYFWAPFAAIAGLEIAPPADLRDRVWMPASVTWANGGAAAALIPTRYAGAPGGAGPAHLLAQATDWAELPGGGLAGLGQRLLVSDAAEHPLMDIRSLALIVAAPAEEARHG
ncbi:type VI secretion system accessory protein TagJ [Oceanicella sp. SM1341]|uniref:type VI secretion system accessory protein TagJ n=1 Tax=Oceanicella sp. SM1341 TaxID=1548889 RepID=UPI000E5486CD|nr:type VI secretion system accessory protein TagJ [Oceanicella sp. SM1341]